MKIVIERVKDKFPHVLIKWVLFQVSMKVIVRYIKNCTTHSIILNDYDADIFFFKGEMCVSCRINTVLCALGY